ncbi:MBL fold metallo-hydrolase [Citricoccus muralis]|uniref:L-ascorbate metabolism protein UlaG (Beta-lactamase superfamily) n=1 Tax=Citricoccus muralis TaxID=169134 RepID=A0A3D9L8G2_9MICC|nr:MBL fold metallo-hydrolase [Citricoccus muralis]REE02648.1 L-ascorbate metabolism protein UlaG (beta-lactamase superfamily) [Citricoccus muralis]
MPTQIVLTKYGHACIRLERDGRRLVVDPGNFTDVPVALDGAEHILVTHEHADHLDDGPVLEYLAAHPDVTVRAPAAAVARLAAAAPSAGVDPDRIIPTGPGEEFETAGFAVQTVGGQHAVIHPQIPVVANTGYLIDGLVYHPGDSYIVPPGPSPDTLLVPLSAPWSKLSEMVDFITAVRPRQAIPVHDGLLNDRGLPMYRKQATTFADRYGTELTVLEEGESTWI